LKSLLLLKKVLDTIFAPLRSTKTTRTDVLEKKCCSICVTLN